MKTEGASKQEMADNLVPIHVRDSCAGVLIPLNKYDTFLSCFIMIHHRNWFMMLKSLQVQAGKSFLTMALRARATFLWNLHLQAIRRKTSLEAKINSWSLTNRSNRELLRPNAVYEFRYHFFYTYSIWSEQFLFLHYMRIVLCFSHRVHSWISLCMFIGVYFPCFKWLWHQ